MLRWLMILLVTLAACADLPEVPDPDAKLADGQSCTTSSDCDSGWCSFAVATCGSQAGVCRARPNACDEPCPGVCGCDMQAYCNTCEAQQAGVSILKPGSC